MLYPSSRVKRLRAFSNSNLTSTSHWLSSPLSMNKSLQITYKYIYAYALKIFHKAHAWQLQTHKLDSNTRLSKVLSMTLRIGNPQEDPPPASSQVLTVFRSAVLSTKKTVATLPSGGAFWRFQTDVRPPSLLQRTPTSLPDTPASANRYHHSLYQRQLPTNSSFYTLCKVINL